MTTFIPINSVSPEYTFINCSNCKIVSLSGLEEENIVLKKDKTRKERAIVFPFSWSGHLSNKDGLKIYDPEMNECKSFKDEGVFKIVFINDEKVLENDNKILINKENHFCSLNAVAKKSAALAKNALPAEEQKSAASLGKKANHPGQANFC